MKNVLVDNLEDLRKSVKECVVLYSGGIDSSYFLLWARKNGVRAIGLHIQLDPDSEVEQVCARAKSLGAQCSVVKASDSFSEEFVSQAIYANGRYQQHFPVCSTLSRPLMARCAIEFAKKQGIKCIVHTSTFVQNSCQRFNNAIRVLGPDILIATPFIKEPIQRDEKLSSLKNEGIDIEEGIYSIDENIWGRVIECGELDDPGNIVPEHVFHWTRGNEAIDNRNITITFEKGLPKAVDGKRMGLTDIILLLRHEGGKYGIGRYNGLEDTLLGVKNHEVRESPAAAIILAAHMALERAVLNRDDLRVKSVLEAEWTDLAVRGLWFSDMREALSLFMERMNARVSGDVVLSLRRGNVMVVAVRSKEALHFWKAFNDGVAELHENFSYKEFFEISSFSTNRSGDL
jgi:argininosuccinate synthase